MKNHPQFQNTPAQFTMIAIEGNIDSEPFDMGGESWDSDSLPIHLIRLSDYWLCEYPVTQAVWETVMGTNPSDFKGATRPVENVSWNDIADNDNINNFLSKLNTMTEGVRPAGMVYRLPTESQWEYAARGGKYWKQYPFDYSGSDKLNEVGWYIANSHSETKPVGLKTPNLLGLYDMSGNVWEWCEDWFDDDFYEKCKKQGIVENPCNREQGSDRVRRGGGYFNDEQNCRPAIRSYNTPSYCDSNIGFRLALFSPSV